MRNYRMTVAYDGTDYHGFQIQVEQPTIQGALEQALAELTQQVVRVHGAGRTDTGVHALGQVVSFAAPWRHAIEDLQRALNAVLPRDISVRDLEPVPAAFHARFSALSREYIYRVYVCPVRMPLLDRYAWGIMRALDRDPLERATRLLVGEADFAAFGQSPSGKSTVRSIHQAAWNPTEGGARCSPVIEQWTFHVVANGFLRGMVRRLVSTLIDVGLGALTPEQFGRILAERDISRASPPAPACGLLFWRANYRPLRTSDE